jgi:hypothetical protein
MKMFSRILSLLVITTMGLFYAGCSKSDGGGDPVAKQQLTALEKKTWVISNVTFGDANENRTTDFASAQLKFTGSYTDNGTYQYAWTGTMPVDTSPWHRTGTIKFSTGDPQHTLIREDAISVTYNVTDAQLTLTFNFEGTGYNTSSRTSSVTGKWVFTFTPAP